MRFPLGKLDFFGQELQVKGVRTIYDDFGVTD